LTVDLAPELSLPYGSHEFNGFGRKADRSNAKNGKQAGSLLQLTFVNALLVGGFRGGMGGAELNRYLLVSASRIFGGNNFIGCGCRLLRQLV